MKARPTSATLLSVVLALAAPWVAAPARAGTMGDPEAGAQVFARDCAVCHRIGEGPLRHSGPDLDGVIGRAAATAAGFRFSRAMTQARDNGLVWDSGTLDSYLADPRGVIAGTSMIYRGLRDEGERADLLAYLALGSENSAAPPPQDTADELPAELLALEGDAEYGAYLAQECTTCHQRSGAAQGIPAITGWPEPRFMAALHAYREGLRENEAMRMVARRLDNEAIAALAAYFSALDE